MFAGFHALAFGAKGLTSENPYHEIKEHKWSNRCRNPVALHSVALRSSNVWRGIAGESRYNPSKEPLRLFQGQAGFVPGTNWICLWDKLDRSLGQTDKKLMFMYQQGALVMLWGYKP